MNKKQIISIIDDIVLILKIKLSIDICFDIDRIILFFNFRKAYRLPLNIKQLEKINNKTELTDYIAFLITSYITTIINETIKEGL